MIDVRQFVPRRMSREMKLLNLRLRRVLFAVLMRATSERYVWITAKAAACGY